MTTAKHGKRDPVFNILLLFDIILIVYEWILVQY